MGSEMCIRDRTTPRGRPTRTRRGCNSSSAARSSSTAPRRRRACRCSGLNRTPAGETTCTSAWNEEARRHIASNLSSDEICRPSAGWSGLRWSGLPRRSLEVALRRQGDARWFGGQGSALRPPMGHGPQKRRSPRHRGLQACLNYSAILGCGGKISNCDPYRLACTVSAITLA